MEVSRKLQAEGCGDSKEVNTPMQVRSHLMIKMMKRF